MFYGLEGRVALVTGGGGGIGKATALFLGGLGARVCVTDMSGELMDGALEKLRVKSIPATGFRLDVSNREEVTQAIRHCIGELGGLHILINAAGIYRDRMFHEMSDEEWRQTLSINLDGVYNCCREAVGPMMEQGYGRIVSLTSQAGVVGSVMHAHYAASKAGIVGLTRTLARELAPYGIHVNCVAPGIIETGMTAAYTPERKRDFLNKIPLGRFGTAAEAARVIAFLASDNASYMTGQTVNVTGGWLMQS